MLRDHPLVCLQESPPLLPERERGPGGRSEHITRFCLVGEPGRLFEGGGRERQTAGLPQAMLQHRLKLGTQTDHPA